MGAKAAEWIRQARRAGRSLLTEVESKRILADYGIPTVRTEVALTSRDAVACAESIGFPVAIKLFSETLTHKAEVGGVRLNIRSNAEVIEAWEQIHRAVLAKAGPGHFLGVTVQPMAPSGALELVIGSSVDPQFGPVLMFGVGGHWIEAIRDTAFGLPPLNTTLAKRLIEQTRVFSGKDTKRSLRGLDMDAIADVLVRFSYLITDLPWIAEMDVNPLLVFPGQGVLAVDARVLLHPAAVPDADLPRPAIRPYPARYERQIQLQDRTPITVRPIRPEDERRVKAWHRTLSDRSVALRYDMPLGLEERVAHERLSRVCFVDYDREMVLVAERKDSVTSEREILGIGRLNRLRGEGVAEFALVIGDPWQGKGLGTALLRVMLEVAHAEGLQRVTGWIHADNLAMLQAARAVGFQLSKVEGTQECVAEWNRRVATDIPAASEVSMDARLA
jgi:acetyltransferase